LVSEMQIAASAERPQQPSRDVRDRVEAGHHLKVKDPLVGVLAECMHRGGGWLNCLGEVSEAAHPVTVAADTQDKATVQQSIHQRRAQRLVAQDPAPRLKALVRRQHRGGVCVTTVHRLE